MASVSFGLKMIEKASREFYKTGKEADKASKQIEKYEKQIQRLEATKRYYNDIKQSIQAKIDRYEGYKKANINNPMKWIEFEEKQKENYKELSRVEKQENKIGQKLEQAKVFANIEKNIAQNTKKDNKEIKDNTKAILALGGSFSIANKVIDKLTNAITTEFDTRIQTKAIATNIKSVAGYDNIEDINKTFYLKYGLNKKDTIDALNRYSKIADSEDQLLKLAKISEYIATATNKQFRGVYESIAGALESGNASGLTTQFFGGKYQDNIGLDNALTANIKGGDTDQFIKDLYSLANDKGYTQSTYDNMQNTFAKRLQKYKNTFFTKDYETQGEYTSKYLPMSERLDAINFESSNQATNTDKVHLLKNDQVELLAKVAELVKPNNTINLTITNNESKTPPEELAQTIKDTIANELNSEIESGANEYY